MLPQIITLGLGIGLFYLIIQKNQDEIKLVMAGKSFPATEAATRFQETNDLVSYGHP